ncbi:MAG: hypothetical protein SGCHY_003824 [Lobulomycetales sp.]
MHDEDLIVDQENVVPYPGAVPVEYVLQLGENGPIEDDLFSPATNKRMKYSFALISPVPQPLTPVTSSVPIKAPMAPRAAYRAANAPMGTRIDDAKREFGTEIAINSMPEYEGLLDDCFEKLRKRERKLSSVQGSMKRLKQAATGKLLQTFKSCRKIKWKSKLK